VRLILPGSIEALRIQCEASAALVGIRLDVVIEADTFTAIRQMIEAGYGYRILRSLKCSWRLRRDAIKSAAFKIRARHDLH